MPDDRNARYDAAVQRLVRCMALTNATLAANPPVMVLELALEPLYEALTDVRLMGADGTVPDTYVVWHDPQAMGEHVAELFAGMAAPVPDTLEGLT